MMKFKEKELFLLENSIFQRFSNCGSRPPRGVASQFLGVVRSFFNYRDCKKQAHSSHTPNY
jgi:hypothetical protein